MEVAAKGSAILEAAEELAREGLEASDPKIQRLRAEWTKASEDFVRLKTAEGKCSPQGSFEPPRRPRSPSPSPRSTHYRNYEPGPRSRSRSYRAANHDDENYTERFSSHPFDESPYDHPNPFAPRPRHPEHTHGPKYRSTPSPPPSFYFAPRPRSPSAARTDFHSDDQSARHVSEETPFRPTSSRGNTRSRQPTRESSDDVPKVPKAKKRRKRTDGRESNNGPYRDEGYETDGERKTEYTFVAPAQQEEPQQATYAFSDSPDSDKSPLAEQSWVGPGPADFPDAPIPNVVPAYRDDRSNPTIIDAEPYPPRVYQPDPPRCKATYISDISGRFGESDHQSRSHHYASPDRSLRNPSATTRQESHHTYRSSRKGSISIIPRLVSNHESHSSERDEHTTRRSRSSRRSPSHRTKHARYGSSKRSGNGAKNFMRSILSV